MTDMAAKPITTPLVRVADLDPGRTHPIQIALDPDLLVAGRDQLDILGLDKVRVTGELIPERRSDWRLKAKLGATVTQACVVTLAPVKTRLDVPITRLFTIHYEEPDPDTETEMPEDVNIDPLGETIDLAAVAIEEISLAMPDYPRAQDVADVSVSSAPEGIDPLTDEDLKPFAALKALKEKMQD